MIKLLNKYKGMPVQLKASIWFLICSFLQKAISSITTPIFTRLLTTEEYGKFSVFYSKYSIFSIILSLNIWGGIYMQGLVKFEKDRKKYSSSLQGLTMTLILSWALLYFLLHDFFNIFFKMDAIQFVAILSLTWTTSAFCFWSSEQRVDFKYKKLVLLTVVVSIFKPVVGVIAICCSNDKVASRIISLAIVELVFYTYCFISQMKRGRTFFSKKYWLYALNFSIPLLPHYLSMTILSSADRIMISSIRNDSEAGIYSLAYSISLIMTMFNSALFQTIEPWLYKKIKQNKIEDISSISYVCLIIIAFLNLLLIALAPEVISVFAPEEYYQAIWVIPPVSMSVFFMFSYTFFATFEFYFEEKKSLVLATLGGAILNIILNFVFIKKYGFCAAAYTTLVCYLLYAGLHFCFMKKICKKKFEGKQPYDLRKLVLISLTFVVLGFLLMYTYSYKKLRLFIVLVLLLLIIVIRKKIVAFIRNIMLMRKGEI